MSGVVIVRSRLIGRGLYGEYLVMPRHIEPRHGQVLHLLDSLTSSPAHF